MKEARGADQDTAGDAADPQPADAPGSPQRILSLRAILTGLALVVILGWVVPWNDWTLGNTLLYNNYLPPAVILVLLVFGLAVNPLLGKRRFHTGEMVVVAVMLLALGGVASSGLNRFLPTAIGTTSSALTQSNKLDPLKQDLDPDEIAELRAAFEQEMRADFAARDEDGNATLGVAELARGESVFDRVDADDDGAVTAEEFVAYQLEHHPRGVPEWRWVLDDDLYVAVPPNGPVAADDPEFHHVVENYQKGFGLEQSRQRVAHRRHVAWEVLPAGETYDLRPAYAGEVARQQRIAGGTFLDLEDENLGAGLLGLRPGEALAIPSDRTATADGQHSWVELADQHYGREALATTLARYNRTDVNERPEAGTELRIPDMVVVTEVQPADIPWYAWWKPLLAWAPLLIGAFIAMIALAGIVRRQWVDNERLPYPIAEVIHSLMERPTWGQRFAAIFQSTGFWIGFGIAGGIIVWNGLYAYQLVPIQIKTSLSLMSTFSGEPWSQVLQTWSLYNLHIYFSILAISFFLSLELSFSLWFFFVASQVLVMFLRMGGVPVEADQVRQASTGGFMTMCLLILWVGRHYYWRVLRSAFTGRGSDEDRQAAPYIWALLASCLVMVAFFVLQGASITGSVLLVVMFLGFLLVISRIVAEAGVPFLQLPSNMWLNHNLFAILGFGFPAAALLPLTAIGITLLADQRESLMPYVVNGQYLSGKVKAPEKRTSGLMLTATVVGCLVAFASMVFYAYTSGGAASDGFATHMVSKDGLEIVANGVSAQSTPESAAMQADQRADTLTFFGVGAAIVGVLGAARFMFASWPLHPIGFLTMASYPTSRIWFSFFLGWMFKMLVMRYGGTGLYTRLKPAAIGLIAGEALALGGFMLVKILVQLFGGITLDSYTALPG